MKPLAALALVSCGACGAAGHAGPVATAATGDPLAIDSEVGLVQLDRVGYAFEPGRVTVFRGAQVIARTGAPGKPWTAAVGLVGPDGARWAVGLAGGALWRVTSAGELESIGARLGIGDARVLAIDASARGFAIGLAGGVAISRDGMHVERFGGGDATCVALASTRAAIGHPGAIEVLDLAHGTRVVYPVDRPSAVAFVEPPGQDARLVALAGGTAYAEDRGVLRRIPAPGDVRELAVSGSRIWLVASGSLFALDPQALVEVAPAIPPSAHIHPAGAHDLWISMPGQSVRYTLEPRSGARDWQALVAPVFERACAKCHQPDGEADLDLSTPARWVERATAIHHMLDTHAMPPAGSPISDADRAALLDWLSR
ncbi:MAG TPA: cytochrome c [Kofleriaceae bacterium]|nr:cytochrome c [Kofleriaceae bacterium]